MCEKMKEQPWVKFFQPLFETVSLMEVSPSKLDWLASKPQILLTLLPMLKLQARATTPGYLHGFWGSNPVLMLAASTLRTEPSP